LSKAQKAKLSNVLHRYKDHFTKERGKCNCFEYRFQLQGGLPKSRNSRPIPFALDKEVQEQIQEMPADHIIEEPYSSYVNPLTLVERNGKRVRICVDTTQVNKFMTPDTAKVPPMQTLLQRFHGANYISSPDLSTAFLHMPLENSSRQWTAFQFQNKVYQNTNYQQMHKESFIINCNTLLHVSTLLDHLQGELFCYRYTKVALYS
jgi:hypothetical protein